MKLRYYIIRRIFLGIIVLVGVSIIVFTLARIVPSDPAQLWVGARARPEQLEAARIKLGLDKPLYVQYLYYMRDLVRGDLGNSLQNHRPVTRDLRAFLPASIELMLIALILTLLIGIPLGAISGKKLNTKVDHASRIFAISSVSIPSFYIGLLLILFAGGLGILPIGGRIDSQVVATHPLTRITGLFILDSILTGNWWTFKSALSHLILPSIALSTYPIGLCTRMTRSTMIETLKERYILSAKASGLSDRLVTYRYALKNTLIPTLSVLGLSFAYMITGTFLIEIIFSWPGMGRYIVTAIMSIDYPVIMGVTILATGVYVAINMIIDIFQAVIDPRIRLE